MARRLISAPCCVMSKRRRKNTAGLRKFSMNKAASNGSLSTTSRFSTSTPLLRIYISTGIHGDEPAGPLAALRLIQENHWPENAEIFLLPCLNPIGFTLNRRENANGIDLNRDYRNPKSAEVLRAHRVAGTAADDLICISACTRTGNRTAFIFTNKIPTTSLPSRRKSSRPSGRFVRLICLKTSKAGRQKAESCGQTSCRTNVLTGRRRFISS